MISLVLLFLLLGCDNKTAVETTTKKSEKPEIKSKKSEVHSFTLETLEGKKLHLTEMENGLKIKEFKEKAIFLIFFGHKCPPCLREIPVLKEMVATGHDDLEVVAIEVQGLEDEALKKFAKTKGINYNLISMADNMDFISYVQTRASWNGSIPFLLGLNKKGEVKIVHVGGVVKSQLEHAYSDLTIDE